MHIDVVPASMPCCDIVIYRKEGDTKPVGFFKIALPKEKIATIFYMYIKPKYRRKGYATRIVDFLKFRFDEVSTQVNASSKESVSYLVSRDFQIRGNTLIWKKPIS